MIKVSYICDGCGKEVNTQENLYNVPIISEMALLNDGSIEINDAELCVDCLCDIARTFRSFKTQ